MRIAIIVLIISTIVGCDDDSLESNSNNVNNINNINNVDEFGGLNQRCYPNSSCNEGLECVEDSCIDEGNLNNTNNSNNTNSTNNSNNSNNTNNINNTNQPICGNRIVEIGEECEPLIELVDTCESLGYYGGEIGCRASDCSYIMDNCISAGMCGDGIVNDYYGEICDGDNLDGMTCEDFGYISGVLECLPAGYYDDACEEVRFDSCAFIGDGFFGSSCRDDNDCIEGHCDYVFTYEYYTTAENFGGICTKSCTTDSQCNNGICGIDLFRSPDGYCTNNCDNGCRDGFFCEHFVKEPYDSFGCIPYGTSK